MVTQWPAKARNWSWPNDVAYVAWQAHFESTLEQWQHAVEAAAGATQSSALN